MLVLAIEIDIDRPPTEVFSYLENAENNPKWVVDMRSCRWLTPPPIVVGSRYEQTTEFLHQVTRSSYEVVAHQPGRMMAVATRHPFPITATRTVDPDGEHGSHVKEVIQADPSGFYRIEAPLLKPIFARNMQRDYRNLKMILEGQPSPAPTPERAQP